MPHYTLPDPLILNDGQRVTDAATWREKRRPEVLRLFEQYVYGKVPGVPSDLPVEVRSVDRNAMGGTAIRKEVTIHFVPRRARSTCSSISPRKPTVQARFSWA